MARNQGGTARSGTSRGGTTHEEVRRESWANRTPAPMPRPGAAGPVPTRAAAPIVGRENGRAATRERPQLEWAVAVLRVGAGLLFMQHGAQKLFGMFGGMGPEGGTAPLISQMGLAGVLEVFGGAAIVLGLLTRPIAALLVIEMIWAYVQAHLPQGFVPIQNGGELALLYALIFTLLATHGAGRLSLDQRVARHGRSRAWGVSASERRSAG